MTRIFLSSFTHDKPATWRAGVLASILFVVVWLSAACSSPATQTSHSDHKQATPATTNPTPRIPAFITNLAEAGPLPAVLDPKQFSDPVVVKAYRYAQESPEIFAQQPCYCYCDSGEGHKGLLDCFASTHGAT